MGLNNCDFSHGNLRTATYRLQRCPKLERSVLPALHRSVSDVTSIQSSRTLCATRSFAAFELSKTKHRFPSISMGASSSLSKDAARKPIFSVYEAKKKEKENIFEQVEQFVISERGLEEAEGVACNIGDLKAFSLGNSSKKILPLNPDTNEELHSLQDLNLSGFNHDISREAITKPVDPILNELHPSVTASSFDFSLKGNRAKCLQRAPVSTAPVITKSTSLPIQRACPQRNSKLNAMTSMEERLNRSAHGNAKKLGRRSLSARDKTQIQQKPRSKSANVKVKKSLCLLACIKPNNVEEEKLKFFQSDFTYNPQFKYDYPASEVVLNRYNRASSTYLPQSIAIMRQVLERYGNYENFEWATGGRILSKTQLWNTTRRYLDKEGFSGDVVVNISNDLISRAAMTINGGRPTLSIRENAAKKFWVEGLLRHEIGTHHMRFHNNRQQVWHNAKVRRQMGLKPANPTEEGLASLHSVLLRKDPSLWRSAILYYTVYQASKLSFSDLFEHLGQFVENPEVRWDYCLRTKRGQFNTAKPGCFCKDQVYLTGILTLLQVRHTLDFHLLCTMGKISCEDIEMLKPHYNPERTKIPSFMADLEEYRSRLDLIVKVNGLEEWLQRNNKESEHDANKIEKY